MLENIVFNLNGQTRRVREHGVDYLVVPMTTITPNGVLPGSKGSLYYPSQETQNSLDSWNDIPIVVYHPEKNGKHCSAQDVPEKHIGQLRGSEWNPTKGLQHEGWLEVNALRRADAWLRQNGKPEILPNILNGQPVSVSTGLYTTNVPASNGYATSPSGRPYTAIATQFVPDHLAILPDQAGACDISDGCGLLVNERKDAKYIIGKTLTWNEWSDAARAASIAARQASAEASKASRKALSPKHAELGRRTFGNDNAKNALNRAGLALKAAEQGKGRSSPLGQDFHHRGAALQHDLAAKEHDRAAESAVVQGKKLLEVLHTQAAESHRNAKAVHEQAERSVTNVLRNSNPEGHNQYTHTMGPNKTPLGQAHPSTFSESDKTKAEGTPELKQWRDAVQAHKDTVAGGNGMRTIAKSRAKLESAHKALTAKVKEPTGNQRVNNMSDKGWLRRLGEAMGIVQNAGERHPQTGQWQEMAKSAAKRGSVSQQHRANTGSAYSDYDDENAPAQGEGANNKPGDDGRDTMLGSREDIDLDGDGDGPVDDDAWRKQDEEAEDTEEPPVQPGNRKGDAVGNAAEKECPKCDGEMLLDNDGNWVCEDCGYEEDDDDTTDNSNPEGVNQYTSGGSGIRERHRATVTAGNATAKAQTTGKRSDHVAAALAHYEAKEGHEESANNSEKTPETKKLHEAAAAYHGMMNDYHNEMSDVTKNSNYLMQNQLDNIWITYNRNWSQSKRDKLDDSDFAGPDQSFPITTQEDLDAAVHSIGRSKHPAGVIKAGIKRIAKSKGLDLPDSMAENANPEGINQYSKSPGGANVPERKTTRAELEEHGWQHLRSTKGGDMYKHKDTKELLKHSAQGFATLNALTSNTFGQPKQPKPIKAPLAGSAQAASDIDTYKSQMSNPSPTPQAGATDMVTNCPKCGGKLTDNTCECGFTKNANPEGHNQYTKGTSADKASKKANKSGTQEDHEDAAAAHKMSAGNALTAGVNDKSMAVASEHLARAKEHEDKASTMKDIAGDKAVGKVLGSDWRSRLSYQKNSLSVTTPPAPVGGGMVMGQDSGQNPMAHAASQQAAVASMDHPPARKPAISAFDHSAAGRDDKAATRHGEAADTHDDAAQDAYSSGDTDGGDQHANAAMLHRKAAAMHSVDSTNVVGNEFDSDEQRMAFFGHLGKQAEQAGKSAKSATRMANKGKLGHKEAAKAHKEAAEQHEAAGNSGAAAHHMKMASAHEMAKRGDKVNNTLAMSLNGLNKQQRSAKLKELRPRMLKMLATNCSCSTERQALNGLNNETLAILVNAKAQGSNADAMGSGDFDDAEVAGGWDKVRVKGDNETFYENDDDDAEESEDGGKRNPPNTAGGSDETRGRVGVGNRRMTENELNQFSIQAFGKPIHQVREEQRLTGNVLQAKKVDMIRPVVAHLSRQEQDQVVNANGWLKMGLEQLQKALLPLVRQQQTVNAYEGLERPDPLYLGASDVPVHNAFSGDQVNNADQSDIDCLVPPVVNFQRWAAEDAAAKNGGHGVGYSRGADSTVREHLSAESAM